jgi:hypothetical protein
VLAEGCDAWAIVLSMVDVDPLSDLHGVRRSAE